MKKIIKYIAVIVACMIAIIALFTVLDRFLNLKEKIDENNLLNKIAPTEPDESQSSLGAVKLSLAKAAESADDIPFHSEFWFDNESIFENRQLQIIGELEPATYGARLLNIEKGLKMDDGTRITFTVKSPANVRLYGYCDAVQVDDVHTECTSTVYDHTAVSSLYKVFEFPVNAGTHTISKGCVSNSEQLYYMSVFIDKSGYKDYYHASLEVDPYYATVKTDWSVEWINPNSEWAADKDIDDYVTLENTSDKSANVVCWQNFSESIVLFAEGEISCGNETQNFECRWRAECVGFPIDYWNGGDKYVDSFDEKIYLDDFVVENGTISPTKLWANVYCDIISGGGADYYPIYGYGYSYDGVDSVLTLNNIFNRAEDGDVYPFSALVDYYQSMGEIKADEYYKVLTFDCDFDTRYEDDDGNSVDYGTLHKKHDIYVRGSAILELI